MNTMHTITCHNRPYHSAGIYTHRTFDQMPPVDAAHWRIDHLVWCRIQCRLRRYDSYAGRFATADEALAWLDARRPVDDMIGPRYWWYEIVRVEARAPLPVQRGLFEEMNA